MISFDAEIIPKVSLGEIKLNDNINNYLPEIYEKFTINTDKYNHHGKVTYTYSIDDRTIYIVTLSDGTIISIEANINYTGKVEGKFYTGITLENVINDSKLQNVLNGCLIIDKNYGYCFILPSPYDEIADSVSNIPKDTILNTIIVSDIEWWINPVLTPEYAK